MPVTVIRNVASIYIRKPSKKQLAEATRKRTPIPRRIIIPLIDGPHTKNNIWCLKVIHYGDETAVDVSIRSLLNCNNKAMNALHDVILQHVPNWNDQFQAWFTQHCILLPIRFNVGDIIFDYNDQIYIKLTYIANDQYRLCFNDKGANKYYEYNTCLYGGKAIDIQKSKRAQTVKLQGKVLYASNESELVANNAENVSSKIIKIISHCSYIGTINTIYLNMKKIKSYSLRFDRYGVEKQVGPIKFDRNIFMPNIKMLLNAKRYIYNENKKEIWFVLDYKEADNLFYKHDWNPFHRLYDEDKVFGHEIQFVYSKKPQTLTVKYYVLQQDIDGKCPIKGIAIIPK